MILVTQLPFVVTLVISFMNWNALLPRRRRGFAGLDNYKRGLHRHPAARTRWSTRSSTPSSVVLVSLRPRARRSRCCSTASSSAAGVVRTLMITPFLIVPVAAALVWKHALYNPDYGLFNGVLNWVWRSSAPQRPAAGLDLRHAQCRRSSSRWSGSGRRS